MLLLLAAACLDPDAALDTAPMSAATYDALAAPDTAHLTQRVDVETAGGARFADATGIVTGEAPEFVWNSVYAVVEEGLGVRVVGERGGLRLLLWLDRADLRLTLPHPTWVNGSGHEAAAGAAGVRVPAGAFLDETEDGLRFASNMAVNLPIDTALVDEVWTPEAREPRVEEERFVAEGTPVVDEAGRVLATSDDDWGVTVLDERDGAVLVEGKTPRGCGWSGVRVRGWVDGRALADERHTWTGYGCCCGCGGFSFGWGVRSPAAELPAGRLLYDAPDGDVVGIATEATTLSIDEEAGEMPGWTAVIVPTALGPVTAWSSPTSLDGFAPPVGSQIDEIWAEAAEREAEEEALLARLAGG